MPKENSQFNIPPEKKESAEAELKAQKVKEKSNKEKTSNSTEEDYEPSISFKQNQKNRSNFDYIDPDEEMLEQKTEEK